MLVFFLMLGPGLAAGAQAATTRSSATMFSDPGDYIGGGQPRLFDSDNGSISVGGTAGYLTVAVSGGTKGDSYSMVFAAPPGQTLAPGVYDRAQTAPFRAAGRPGIDIYGDGRGCNETTGRFEVRDLAVDSNGVPTRLWIVYEQHCEGGPSALFGEVRLGEPVAGAAAFEPTVVRWPPADVGQSATTVPITFVAQAPTSIIAATVRGDNPGDFPIRVDECTGQRLVAGSSCQVWVRFVPSSAGSRAAVLRITHGDGSHEAMALQGFAYGGRTGVVLKSEPGDWVGGGASYSYDPGNATFNASGSRQHVRFRVNAADGSWWDSDFAPSSGDVLAPGRYEATRYPFNGSGPGMDVFGNSRGCNTLTGSFTVTDAAFDSDGALKRFGASFVQHCDGAGPALTGTFEFRAGDTTTPAPWMTTGPLTSLPVDDNRDPPVNLSPPSISGAAKQGQTLTESHGSWLNNPTAYSYQWQRCAGNGTNCVAIANANGQTYTLTPADAGSTIRVQETASNGDGAGPAATSAQTAVVTGPPVNLSPPSIIGSARQGQTLTEAHGSWSNNPTGYTYQWQRCAGNGTNCAAIANATAQTYTLTSDDVDSTIRVQETASNADGPGSAATSTQTAVVIAPPVNLSPPSISGSAIQGEALTEAHGSWSNNPTGYTYQWQRCAGNGTNCAAIVNATAQTYTLTPADAGSTIRVQETASNAAGPSAPATSTQTTAVTTPPGNPDNGSGSGAATEPQSSQVTSTGAIAGPDILPPGVSDYGVTNTRFVVGSGPTPLVGRAAAGKRPQGTTFRYTLSETGTVRIVIGRRVGGRRRGRRCLASTRKLASAKKCTRIVVNVTLTRVSHPGVNRVFFSGRFGPKALKPGSYQATLTATDSANNASKPQAIVFTIAK